MQLNMCDPTPLNTSKIMANNVQKYFLDLPYVLIQNMFVKGELRNPNYGLQKPKKPFSLTTFQIF